MRTSRITDDMFARIPALLHEGMTKEEIAEANACRGVSCEVPRRNEAIDHGLTKYRCHRNGPADPVSRAAL